MAYVRVVVSRREEYGDWLACCLSRGPLSPLLEKDVALLAEEMGEESYAGGTFVFRQGDPAAKVHILTAGTIELSRVVKGRRATFQILHPGDVFGDVPVFLGEPEPFDARAAEDCTVLALDAEALFTLLSTRPLIARRWFISMADRMSGLQGRVADLLAGGLECQLTSILLRESDDRDRVRITQNALAQLLGVQRSSVQRVLKQLEASELIALRYRSIDLIDRVELELLCAGVSDD